MAKQELVQPLSRTFPLLTEGRLPDLDALNICYEALRDLQGREIDLALRYLTARFTRSATL